MKLLTLVHHPFELWNTPSWFSARLHQDFPTVEATQESSYEGIEPHLRDAEVISQLVTASGAIQSRD